MISIVSRSVSGWTSENSEVCPTLVWKPSPLFKIYRYYVVLCTPYAEGIFQNIEEEVLQKATAKLSLNNMMASIA